MSSRLLLRAGLAAVSLILASAPAPSATPAADALEQFGFFGVWAVHCGNPASPSNVQRHAYISALGEPGFTESLGPDLIENTYRILGAPVVEDDRVTLNIELNNTTIQKLTMVRDGNRIRTLTNELGDGRVVVQNGKVVVNGAPTPWLTLCRKSP